MLVVAGIAEVFRFSKRLFATLSTRYPETGLSVCECVFSFVLCVCVCVCSPVDWREGQKKLVRPQFISS